MDAALNACLYTGDRTFDRQPCRDTQRENAGIFAEAEAVYQSAIARGEPRHKVANLTTKKTGVPLRKIWEWARKFNWRDEFASPKRGLWCLRHKDYQLSHDTAGEPLNTTHFSSDKTSTFR